MKKIMCVSDLHGKSFKEIYDRINGIYNQGKKIDEIIVMGDYTDSYIYDIKGEIEFIRLKEVINIAKKDKRVKLILGNHEAHYLYGGTSYFSKNVKFEKEIKKILEDNIKMFYYVIKRGKYLISHQGITKTMLKELKATNNIEKLNRMLHQKKYEMFTVENGIMDWYMKLNTEKSYDDWERLIEDKVDNYKQIVGHFTMKGFVVNENIFAIENVEHGNMVTIEIP